MNRVVEKALVFAALASAACHTMVPMSFEEVGTVRPGTVYVTRDDQTVLELTGPQVFGDTLVGYIGGTFHELDRDEVARVTVKRNAKGKTMALVAASIAGAAAVGVMISGLGEEGQTANVDCNDVPDDPRCMGQGP